MYTEVEQGLGHQIGSASWTSLVYMRLVHNLGADFKLARFWHGPHRQMLNPALWFASKYVIGLGPFAKLGQPFWFWL